MSSIAANPGGRARTILHADMDAFYASVEQRDNPALRGKPVLVGGGWGGEGKRGVVMAASYEARAFGCRAAMPGATARRLCPQGIFVRGRMDVYVAVSKRLRGVLESFTPDVQPISIDEAFLDCTGVMHLHASAGALAREIRAKVRRELDLPCSIGVSGNKFLAKLASDLAKPDGVREIPIDEAAGVLAPLPVSVLFGVGPKTAARFERAGVRSVADFRRLIDERGVGAVARDYGESVRVWAEIAWGRDERPVEQRGAAKSIGKERTFSDDVGDADELRATLLAQVEDSARRLRGDRLRCRRVTVKLRLPCFRTFTRSITLADATDATGELWRAAGGLLEGWIAERRGPLRLLGVALHDLHDARQMELFGGGGGARPEPRGARPPVDAAADAIVAKFGKGAIRRGGTMR